VIARSKADTIKALNNEPRPGDGEAQMGDEHVLTMIRIDPPNAVHASYIAAGGALVDIRDVCAPYCQIAPFV
jgi:hypothetical protein